jgi:hypothetical protein
MDNDKYKPAVLNWLSEMVNYKFEHHYSDKWINVNIRGEQLSISFDTRQNNQVELFKKLPECLKGVKNIYTGELVNKHNLYFKITEICKFEYPKIISSKVIKKNKHQETEKGWYIKGSYWYSYDWEVTLSDGTTINYHNQNEKMDLKEDSNTFKTKICEREFYKFVSKFK